MLRLSTKKLSLVFNLLLSDFNCIFQLLTKLLAYLVGEAVAELWEDLAVEDAPDGAVVECELLTLVLGDAVAEVAVLHVEEADVGHEWDADGA